ncbi:MerR family transcriptional regulator [Dongia rigui]|uniref:MerR family transcriptional regulator n=1 Tax=Dongia rigui TaxID=940149 RepID=A0ABU5E0J1_9PROT|nr:MerR family transcriptional regulator [Dongia rigui]MDY0873098.1 MerR family transcriptional regulator [Dongia rigui]
MSSSAERLPAADRGAGDPLSGKHDAAAQRRANARRVEKAAGAFRTISEVADDLEVPQHVLRFWETKFPQIKPMKRGGGRRYYRPEDVDLLRAIRGLLYDQGYTIKGVQKLIREGALRLGADLAEVEALGLGPDSHGNGHADGHTVAEAGLTGDGATDPAMAAKIGQAAAMLDLPLFKAATLDERQMREVKAITTELEELRDRLRKVLG